ncbi:MAG: PepSY-associated TM helix domain-containing protein [Burkholderiales bacterium]
MDVLGVAVKNDSAGAQKTVPLQDAPAASSYRFFWRLHFWSGLITAPIVLFAAATGLIYVLSPPIERVLYRQLDTVVPSGEVRSLDAQIAAARKAVPDLPIRSVIVGSQPEQSTQVLFGERKRRGADAAKPPAVAAAGGEHAHHTPTPAVSSDVARIANPIVYLNPYTAEVLGVQAEMDRFRNWSEKLHSTALQGESWRWIIELGASWLLVMLATGLYLWWPKPQAAGGQGVRALVPRMNESGARASRIAWRDWHAVIGIAASAMLLIILVTGLTWSKYTGENFRAALNATGQSSPKPPEKLQSIRSSSDQMALNAAQVLEIGRRVAPDIRLALTPPRGGTGVWRIANSDRRQPTARVQLIVDQYSGAILYRSGWDELPIGAKATGIGIPFHRGEFGWWNQALLIFTALAVIASVVSGFVMWWKRRPVGKLAAPAISWGHVRAVPWWMVVLALGLGYVMPVFGISLAALLAVEVCCLCWVSRKFHLESPSA